MQGPITIISYILCRLRFTKILGYKQGNWGKEKLSDLLKVNRRVKGDSGFELDTAEPIQD